MTKRSFLIYYNYYINPTPPQLRPNSPMNLTTNRRTTPKTKKPLWWVVKGMEGRFGVGGDCFRMSTATMLSAEDLAATAAAALATRPALAFSATLTSSAAIVERTRDGVAGHDGVGGHDGAGGVELLAGGSAQGVDGLAVIDHGVPLPEELEPLLEGVEEVVLDLVAVPAATVRRAEGGHHRPRDPLRRRLRVKPRRRWSRDLLRRHAGVRQLLRRDPARESCRRTRRRRASA